MTYLFNLMSLWLCGKISFSTVRYAIKNKPIAVCGKSGGYVVNTGI